MTLPVRIINHEEVGRLLPMDACVDLMGEALKAYSEGRAKVPLRSIVWLPERTGGLGLMPGHLESPEALGLKVVTVFPKNEGTPYESHQGVVLLFDSENGRLLSAMDAAEITAIRTAASSGIATRLLAREDAGDLALIDAVLLVLTTPDSLVLRALLMLSRPASASGSRSIRSFLEILRAARCVTPAKPTVFAPTRARGTVSSPRSRNMTAVTRNRDTARTRLRPGRGMRNRRSRCCRSKI